MGNSPSLRATARRSTEKLTPLILVFVILFSVFSFIVTAGPKDFTISSSGKILVGARPLHVEGRYIKNDLENIIFLRGVNRDHFHDVSSGAWGDWGTLFTSEAAKELDYMKTWGTNVLRLITAIQFWNENTPAWIDGQQRTHQEAIKTIIEMCAERDIYVVYCPWTVASGHRDEGLPWPPYTTDSNVIADLQAFVSYWVDVSRELRQYPNIIYEIWNEPWAGGTSPADLTVWHDGWNSVINAIRNDGDEHLIVVMYDSAAYWPDNPLNWVWDYPFNQSNIVYSTHLYRWYNHLGGDKPTDYDTIKQRLTDMRYKEVVDDNKPLWIGEIGGSFWQDQQNEAIAFANTLRIYNEWEMGYAGWDFWDAREFALVEYKSTKVDPAATIPTLSGQALIDAIQEAQV